MSLATLPRSLRIAATTPITRTHVLALYKEQLSVAQSFSSYNFREYFVRRTKDKFRSQLPSLLNEAYSVTPASLAAGESAAAAASPSLSSPSSSSSPSPSSFSSNLSNAFLAAESPAESESIYAPTGGVATTSSGDAGAVGLATTPEARLREWYSASLDELAVMTRASFVNRMYEGPRLVVERQIITGGGGAGAEASYGGAGQPADGNAGTSH